MKRYEWGEEGENAENSVLESPMAERDFQRLEKQPTRLLNNQDTEEKEHCDWCQVSKVAEGMRQGRVGSRKTGYYRQTHRVPCLCGQLASNQI